MNKKKLYTITMEDESMQDIAKWDIRKGDTLIIEPTKEIPVINGETIEDNGVYVSIVRSDTIISRITKTESGVILSFHNWDYPPRYFSYESLRQKKICIIGKVIERRCIL